jgi:hypothetical protein
MIIQAQQLLPLDELNNYKPPEKPVNSSILFQIPAPLKDDLIRIIKLQNLTFKGLLNGLITDYLETLKSPFKQKIKTGRGNVNKTEINLAKEYLRKKHPQPVRIVDIANYCNVKQTRAARLVDLLSGGENKGDSASKEINDSFLVYQDEDTGEVGIFKDEELGIKP